MILTVKQAIEFTESNGGKISRETIYKWQREIPQPAFFVPGKKVKVDVSHPDWLRRVSDPKKTINRKKISEGHKQEGDDELSPPHIPSGSSPQTYELEEQARIAALNDTIFAAKIREEKSKQEEIKTLELKKDLAPMYLIKHFFSFAENLIQRTYRRYSEISPELEALYLAGKPEQAIKLLLREQESINQDSVRALKKAIEEEGYKV